MRERWALEQIPAAAIGGALEKEAALIVESDMEGELLPYLTPLYAHSPYKLYITSLGLNQLSKCQRASEEIGLKSIVLSTGSKPNFSLLQNREKPFSLSAITPGGLPFKEEEWLTFLNNPLLKEFSLIGHQLYRTNPELIATIDQRGFEKIRLGEIREEIQLAEPLLRDKEYHLIDLNALRRADNPNTTPPSPNGLYAEELAQLARYIGMAQEPKTLFIYGLPSNLKSNPAVGEIVAEIIWHVVEGFASNIQENPLESGNSSHFLRRVVSMGDQGQELIFITSKITGRWWMEMTPFNSNKRYSIPCSYQDYKTSLSGDIPIRWLLFCQKLGSI